MTKNAQSKRPRFAIYTRYSSEMQNEMSLEAQEEQCTRAIAQRGGVVVQVYSDSAKSGWSLNRDGFNELQRAAARNRFDAVMFWKFDRLARNHSHAVMIKLLLRSEYGLKLHCVEGFSEDDDDSPYSAMMEQMLAVFAAFYSKNLSNEAKRGKYQRAINGLYNGSTKPVGYNLIRVADGTPELPAGLHPNQDEAAVVFGAFMRYSTGNESDSTIGQWMMRQPAIQILRAGKKPIGKETVRDMLQNRLYVGEVRYIETEYKGSLGQGRKAWRNRQTWFPGQHEAIVPLELFEKCQEVRKGLARHNRKPEIMRTYILHDRVFCARCVSRKPTELEDANYGKMRPAWDTRYDRGRYRCQARDRGYHNCGQSVIYIQSVDEQVYHALRSLTIPQGYKDRVEEAVRGRLENEVAYKQMEKIKGIIERTDYRWDEGLISQEEYIAKRRRLQSELENLRPIDYDELMEAADLLENFSTYWDECETVDNPEEARKQLISKIVSRVYVYDKHVRGIALHGDFGIILDDDGTMPDEVREGLEVEIKKGTSKISSERAQDGIDGI